MVTYYKLCQYRYFEKPSQNLTCKIGGGGSTSLTGKGEKEQEWAGQDLQSHVWSDTCEKTEERKVGRKPCWLLGSSEKLSARSEEVREQVCTSALTVLSCGWEQPVKVVVSEFTGQQLGQPSSLLQAVGSSLEGDLSHTYPWSLHLKSGGEKGLWNDVCTLVNLTVLMGGEWA